MSFSLLPYTPVHGDELRDGIQKSLTEHDVSIEGLRGKMDKALREAIKEAANGERLAEIRAMLDQRERFLDTGELPKLPACDKAVKDYSDARKESALRVCGSYRSAIEAAAKRLLLDEAKSIRDEMDSFIDDERVAIGLPRMRAKTDAAPKESVRIDSTVDTAAFLEEFIARFIDELEDAAKLPTTAQQDEEHRKIAGKFNAEIQKKTLAFQFPIDDVEEQGESFHLHLGTPPQLKDITHINRMGGVYERLKRSEALSLAKDSTYVISGVGRLTFAPSDFELPDSSTRLRRIFAFQSPHNSAVYGIYVQAYKTKLQK